MEPADAPMEGYPLFTGFEETPRRRKIHRPADRDRECLFCWLAIEAFRGEPHRVVSGGGIGMSQDGAIGDDSIAKIPVIGEGGHSIFGRQAGAPTLFPGFRLRRYLECH